MDSRSVGSRRSAHGRLCFEVRVLRGSVLESCELVHSQRWALIEGDSMGKEQVAGKQWVRRASQRCTPVVVSRRPSQTDTDG